MMLKLYTDSTKGRQDRSVEVRNTVTLINAIRVSEVQCDKHKINYNNCAK